uniref:Uncharacterized protein n=2 Tax=Anguilla anguilla TaxID=7936 RepID=A0A0E9UX41_ANGAN
MQKYSETMSRYHGFSDILSIMCMLPSLLLVL